MNSEWVVAKAESGTKLSAFLKEKCGEKVSAKHIKRSLDAGLCYLNGTVEKFASKLVGTGDKIAFSLAQEEQKQPFQSNRILYIDDDLIAYDKPAGIPSTDPKLIEDEKGARLLHRLDRDTTGVLLFARNDAAEEKMLALFKARKIEKRYLAIVCGQLKGGEGTINSPLGKISSYQGQTIWGVVAKPDALPAITRWKLLKKDPKKGVALLSCEPETGRTHQIRVHLSHIGCPIIGDKQYGRSVKIPYTPKRMLLHAEAVAFPHPATHKQLEIRSPLPTDFKEALIHFFGDDSHE